MNQSNKDLLECIFKYGVQISPRIILPPCPICGGQTDARTIDDSKWHLKEGNSFDCRNEKCEEFNRSINVMKYHGDFYKIKNDTKWYHYLLLWLFPMKVARMRGDRETETYYKTVFGRIYVIRIISLNLTEREDFVV